MVVVVVVELLVSVGALFQLTLVARSDCWLIVDCCCCSLSVDRC